MTEFKIERGVPIPKHRQRRSKYPWSSMKVGDSVGGLSNSATVTAYKWAAHNKAAKVMRQLQPDGTYRVWRVK